VIGERDEKAVDTRRPALEKTSPAVPALQRALNLPTTRLVFIGIVVATAIPVALGPPAFRWWLWRGSDILANVVLYVPLGLALGPRASVARTITASASLSGAIEIAQLFYVNRNAHPMDIACNVVGALIGRRLASRTKFWPGSITLNRHLGAAALFAVALWIMSSRTFRMFLGGYGWFASGVGPRFWQSLPRWVIDAGLATHSLGLLANTAIAGLLAAAGVIGLLQIRHLALRAVIGGLAGFTVGNMMTPNLNVFPFGPAIMGTVAGLCLAVCVVAPSPDALTHTEAGFQ
jgi:hypothetical protein